MIRGQRSASPDRHYLSTEIPKHADIHGDLSLEEELELGKRIQNGDVEALHELTKANLRLVVNIAKQYMNKGVRLNDLVSAGNLGLVRAAHKYDYKQGNRFSTYATWWIKLHVLKELNRLNKRIEVKPTSMQIEQKYQKLAEQPENRSLSDREVMQILLTSPDQKIIKDSVKQNPKKLEKAITQKLNLVDKVRKAKSVTYGHSSGNSENEHWMETTIAAPDSPDLEKLLLELNQNLEYLRNIVQNNLIEIRDVEKDILLERVLVFDKKVPSLEELGDRHGLTKERIRQLESKVKTKLYRTVLKDDSKYESEHGTEIIKFLLTAK